MHSRSARWLTALAGIFSAVLALLLATRGVRPRPPLAHDREAAAAAPGRRVIVIAKPVRRALFAFAGMFGVAAIIGAALYAGYAIKDAKQRRATAIAMTGGDPDLALQLMIRYGCAGCHTIPGVPGANGLVGPRLTDAGRRIYLGGVLTNTPDHLIRWISNPQAVAPGTAMPVTGITPDEAKHVAAYLYAIR